MQFLPLGCSKCLDFIQAKVKEQVSLLYKFLPDGKLNFPFYFQDYHYLFLFYSDSSHFKTKCKFGGCTNQYKEEYSYLLGAVIFSAPNVEMK